MDTREPLNERIVRRLTEILGPAPKPALDAAAKAAVEEVVAEAVAFYGDDRGLNRFRT